MHRVVLRRLAVSVPTLVIVSVIAFSLVLLLPGDAATSIAGQDASRERIVAIRDELGLDDPLLTQYRDWAGDAVRGDLGTSLVSGQEVTDMIAARMPATVSLTLFTMAFILAVSIPVAVFSAAAQRTWLDRIVMGGVSVVLAMPAFWIGLVLLLAFALRWHLLPATGYVAFTEDPVEWARHLFLPAIALGAAGAAEATRQLRTALDDALSKDYVRAAEAKGLPRRLVIGKHALKNALVPLLTVLGLQVSFLLGGAVVVENVFAIPGMGQLAIKAVLDRDVPLIQGVVILSAVMVLITSLVVDVLYGIVNPKVRAA